MHVFANGQLASAPAAAQEATPASEGLEAPMVAAAGTDNLTPVLASIIGRDITDVFLRSYNWVRWHSGIPLPKDRGSILITVARSARGPPTLSGLTKVMDRSRSRVNDDSAAISLEI
jgi:hypothetical protein